MLPELGRGDVLLQVADKERPRRLRMVLVDLGLVRPELVVLDIVALVWCYLDLAAEKQLVVGHLERLLHVLGLLEADQGVPVAGRPHHLHPRHFAVFLVLMEETVLEGRVAAAYRQITHAYCQRSAVLGDGGISAPMRRTTGRRTGPGTAASRATAPAAAAATGTAAAARRAASASRFPTLFLVLSQRAAATAAAASTSSSTTA